jgi:uncharacterized protein (TIGR02145 family)
MAQNVGALNADTNAIFEALRAKGVPVPANAQLSDVADMIESIVPPHQNEVEIGGRWYPYVQIGNQLWMAENLDWKLDGIGIGGTSVETTPHAWYYDNDETTYGINGNKYGLLYNAFSLNLIQNNLPSGWRVPNRQDLSNLLTIPKDDLADSSWFGNDSTGFSAVPSERMGTAREQSGNLVIDFVFVEFNAFLMWSNTTSGSIGGRTLYYHIYLDSFNFIENDNYDAYGMSVRLVKDVT